MLYLSRTNISKLQIIIHFLNIAVLGYFFFKQNNSFNGNFKVSFTKESNN